MKSRLLQSRHMSFLSVLFLFKNSSWCVVIHCGIGIAGLAKPARLLFLAAVEFLSSFFFTFSIFRAKDFYSIIIIGSDFISNYLLVHCSFSRAFKCKASSQSSWPPVDQHWLHTVWKLCQKVSFCKTVIVSLSYSSYGKVVLVWKMEHFWLAINYEKKLINETIFEDFYPLCY